MKLEDEYIGDILLMVFFLIIVCKCVCSRTYMYTYTLFMTYFFLKDIFLRISQ